MSTQTVVDVIVSGSTTTVVDKRVDGVTTVAGEAPVTNVSGQVPDLGVNTDILATQGDILSLTNDVASLRANLIVTGTTLTDEIGVLSGVLISTGNQLNFTINNLSGDLIATGNSLDSLRDILSGNLLDTGQNLQNQISSNDVDIARLEDSTGDLQLNKFDKIGGTISGNIVPSASGSLSIGTPELPFLSGHFHDITISNNTLFIGDVPIHSSNGGIDFQSATGQTIFKDVTIRNLTVTGSETIIDVEHLAVKDNTITLNTGETGAGISLITGGLIIDRGSLTDADILFNEENDRFEFNFPVAIQGSPVITQGITGSFVTQAKLTETGNTLESQVNTVDDRVDSVVSNLGNTGITLTSSIDSLSGTTDQSFLSTGLVVDSISGNLISTGANLQTQVNNISTNVGTTGQTLQSQITSNLNNLQSVETNLITTGQTLTNKINSDVSTVSSNLATTGQTLTADILTVSGEINQPFDELSGNLVTTGQTLQTQITSNDTGILENHNNINSTGELLLANINTVSSNLVSTGLIVDDVSGNLITTGQSLQADIAIVSGIATGGSAQDFRELSGNLITTGQTLQSQITSNDNDISNLSGSLSTTGQTLTSLLVQTGNFVDILSGNLITTGNLIDSEIAVVSGLVVQNDGDISTLQTATGTLKSLIDTDSANLISTGNFLNNEIAIVSGIAGGQDVTVLSGRVNTLSGNLITTGQTLASDIATVSGLTTGSSSDPALSGKVDTLSGNLITTGQTLQTQITSNDSDISTLTSNLGVTGQTLQTQITSNDSDISTITSNLAATGQTLQTQITSNDSDISTLTSNLITTGQTLTSEIAIVSGLTTGSSSDPALSGKVDTLSGNLITTGQTLQTQITSNDSDIASLTSNLVSTGQTLTTDITTVSGLIVDNDGDITALKTATGVLKTSTDSNAANLITTGQTLQTQITSNDGDISTLTTNLGTTGQTLQTQITSNDSDITTLTSNLITTGQTLTTDITTVSGLITDNDADITALKSATGVLKTSTDANTTNLITTGQTLQTQITSNDGDITTLTSNLVTTGQTLQTQITSNDSDISTLTANLGTTGQTLQTQITSNDGDITTLTSNLVTTGQTLTTNINTVATNLGTSGQTLQTQITSNDSDISTLTSNLGTTGQTLQTQITSNDSDIASLTTNLGTTGQTLQTQITSNDSDISTLDSTTVKLTTNQSIAGNKIFTNDVTINNLTVTGTEVVVDVENLAVKDNIIEINSGESGAGISRISGGIVIDRGTATNANILYNDANDRFELNFPLAVEGEVVASASNLITTGQTLTTNINTVSTNLGTSGQTLQTQITSNDSDISTLTTNLGSTGQTLQTQITSNDSDISTLTTNLGTTGQTLQTQITSNDSDISTLTTNLGTTGQTLQTQITSNDSDISTLTSNLVTTGQTLTTNINTVSTNLISTGKVVDDISGDLVAANLSLQSQITSNDTDITNLSSNLVTTGQTLTTNINTVATNLVTTGQTLTSEIATVSGLINAGAIDGTGVSNYTARWSDSNTLTTGALYDSGTRVGIGTNAPDYTLDVAGNIGVDQKIYHNGDPNTYLNFLDDRFKINVGGIVYIDCDDSTSAPHNLTINDGSNNIDFIVKGTNSNQGNPLFKTDASTNRVGINGIGSPEAELEVDGTILATGPAPKIAIGTISPGATLHVNGATSDILAKFVDGSDGVDIATRGANRQQIDFLGSNTSAINAKGSLRINYDSDNSGTNDSIVFGRNGADESGTADLVINEGAVGIGTNNPDYTLTVNAGTTNEIARFKSTDNDALISISDNTDAVYVGLDASADIMSLGFSNSFASTNLSIDTGGKVGIGTNSPSMPLHVNGSSAGDGILYSRGGTEYFRFDDTGTDLNIKAANALAIYTNGTSAINISTSQKVGIGTNAPNEKLHIVDDSDPTVRITNTDGGTDDTAAFELGVSTNTAIASTRIEARRQSDGSVDLNFRGAGTTSVAQTSAQMTLDGVSGAVGINTTSPNVSSKLHVYGWTIIESATNFASLRLQSTTGSWDIDNNNGTFGLQWAGGDKLTLSNSGNLTVGGSLSVSGGNVTINNSMAYRVGGDGTTLVGSLGNASGVLSLKSDGTRDVQIGSNSYPTAIFVEGSNGQVGIGTNNPRVKLHVVTSSVGTTPSTSLDDLVVENNGAGGITLINKNDSAAGIAFADDDQAIAGLISYNHNGNNLRFTTNGNTEAMRIDSSQQVGIGTNAPSTKLHVAGDIKSKGDGKRILLESDSYLVAALTRQGTSGSAADQGGLEIYNAGTTKVALFANTTSYINNGANFGIGTNAPGVRFHLVGAAGTVNSLATSVTAATMRIQHNSASSLSIFSGNTTSSETYFQAANYNGTTAYVIALNPYGGSVGIGTNAPADHLQVKGSGSQTLRATSTNSHASIIADRYNTSSDANFIIQTGGVNKWRLATGLGGNDEKLTIYDDIADVNMMSFKTAVGVGVGPSFGTREPEAPLHILGGYDANNPKTLIIAGREDSSTVYGGIQFEQAGGNTFFGIGNDSRADRDEILIGGGFGSATNATALRVFTGTYDSSVGTERLTILSSGSVGIGNAAPAFKLQVNGDVRINSGSAFLDDGQSIRWGGTAAKIDGSSGGDYLRFYTDGAERMRIISGGNVGIGTNSPVARLHVHETTAGRIQLTNGTSNATASDGLAIAAELSTRAYFWLYENAYMQFATNNAERMRITADGNVGIGTNSPAHKFEVYGGGGGTFGAITNRQSANANTDGIATVSYDSGNQSLRLWVDANGHRYLNAGTTAVISFTTTAVNIRKATTFSSGRATFSGTAGADGVVLAGGENNNISSRLFFDNGTSGEAVTILNNTAGMEFRTGGTPGSSSGTIRMYLNSAGNLGIGTGNPPHKLSIYGTGAGKATVQIEGEGGADPYINFLVNNTTHWAVGADDSASDSFKISQHSALGTNDRITVLSGGSVGIGVADPDQSLEVAGAIKSTGAYGFYAGRGDTTWASFGSGVPTILLRGSLDNSRAGAVHFKEYDGTDTAAIYSTDGTDGYGLVMAAYQGDMKFATGSLTGYKMVILGGGSVGIGTASPDNFVHIREGGLAGRSASNSNTSLTIEHHANTGIQFFSGTQTQIRFGDAASTAAGAIIYEHSGDNFKLNFTDHLTINGSGGEKVRVKNDGNVGIGTNAPVTKLDIWGGTGTRPTDPFGGQNQLFISQGSTTNAGITISADNNGGTQICTFIQSNTSVSAALIGTQSNHGARIRTNNTDRITIASGGAITFNSAFTFPTSDGSSGQTLQTDGSGNVTWSSAGTGTISGSGTDNYIPRFNGTSALENSAIYDNGSNRISLGTVTTSPLQALHVQSTGSQFSDGASGNNNYNVVVIDQNAYTNNYGGGILFGGKYNSSGNTTTLAMVSASKVNGDGNFGGKVHIGGREHGTSNVPKVLTVTHASVGIGTVTPAALLHVDGIAIIDDLRFDSLSSHFIKNDGNLLRIAGDNGVKFQSYDGGWQTRMTIVNDGNVGIGTVTPAAHLHVSKAVGATTVLTQVAANSTVGFEIKKTGSTTQHWKIVDGQTANGYLEIYDATDSATRMAFNTNGNVGIGTVNAPQLLTIKGDAKYFGAYASDGSLSARLGSDSSGDGQLLLCDSNGTTKIMLYGESGGTNYINNGGNFGVGTASPNGRLHVYTGSAGSTTPNTNHDDIIIESSGNAGLQLFTPDANYQYIAFGSPAGANRGYVRYGHNEEEMVLRAATVDILKIKSTGVGIGTTPNSSAKLESYITSGGEKGLRLNSNFSGGNAVDFVPAVAGVSNAGFSIDVAGTNRFVINDGGNVGIGTNSSNAHLKVQSASGSDVLVRINTGNTETDARLMLGEADTYGMTFEYDGVSNIGYLGMNDNVQPTGSWSKRIQMSRAGTEVAFMAGNVGIGSASPGGKLHVYGGTTAFTNLSDNTDSIQITRNSSVHTHQDAKLFIYDNSNADWAQKIELGTASYGLRIGGWTDYGVAVYQNTKGLVFSARTNETVINDGAADYDFRVEGDTDDYLLFTEGSTDRVAISTTAPAAKLHVEGDFKVGTTNNGNWMGYKDVSLNGNTYTTALTINLNNHTGCYVKLFLSGDWSSHSAVAFVGEYFIQNGSDGYAEPGTVISEFDNTNTDSIESKIVDPSSDTFTIQLKLSTAANGTLGGKLSYHVMGMATAVS